MEDTVLLHLPLDIIDKILSNITDPASLACLASTCKFWRHLIKDPSFLDCLQRRRHNHGFTPSLLLGFFYQDNTMTPPHSVQHERDKRRCLAPKFMPMSELTQFIGNKAGCNALKPVTLGTFIRDLGANLNFYEPIASQDGFLALCLAQSDNLCVCNALTGEIFYIPPIPVAQPNQYALLVSEDVSLDGWTSQCFQLVVIWIRERSFFGGYYCSKRKRWLWFGHTFELLPGLYMLPSPAVASHGAIHFLCGSSLNWNLTHVATLHAATLVLSYVELPLDAKRSMAPLLANSANGELLLLFVKDIQMSLWKHDSKLGSDTGSWVLSKTIDLGSYLPLRVVQMQARAKIRLEIFLGKSGAVVLWVDGEGLFLFTLSDGSMRKIGNERATKKYCFQPYEIDWLSCLTLTNLVIDDSLSLDVGRKKIEGRWRTLMARHMNKRHLQGKA